MTTLFQCHSFHFEHTQGLPEGTNTLTSIGVEHGEIVMLEATYPDLNVPYYPISFYNYENLNYSLQYVSSLWLPPKVSLFNV